MFVIRYGWDTPEGQMRWALTLHAGRELRRAELPDDGHAGAGADAISSGIDHRVGIGRGANAARSFYAGLAANNAAHQGNIFWSGGAKESSSGLDEVSFGGEAELAAENFFFQREQRSFKNHFKNSAAGMRNFRHSGNVIQNALPVAGFQRTYIHDHVHFMSAQADGLSSFKALYCSVVRAQREADGGGNFYRRPVQHGDSQADPPGIYADGGKVEARRFFTQTDNLICGGF